MNSLYFVDNLGKFMGTTTQTIGAYIYHEMPNKIRPSNNDSFAENNLLKITIFVHWFCRDLMIATKSDVLFIKPNETLSFPGLKSTLGYFAWRRNYIYSFLACYFKASFF